MTQPSPALLNISNISTTSRSPSSTIHYVSFPQHANSVIDPDTSQSMEYRDLIAHKKYRDIWTRSFTNKMFRLEQGLAQREVGTNTVFFLPHSKVPNNFTVTYGRIVCELNPHKNEVARTRLTVGVNLIAYPGDLSTKTAGLSTAKQLFNIIISTLKARFMDIDVKNVYLKMPM